MKRTAWDFYEEELYELLVQGIFSVTIYAIIAYKAEALQKLAFVGRETRDKAFHRWLKIF